MQGVKVELATELGDVELQLYPDQAPISTANFLNYVNRGLYDGATFYRVVRENNDSNTAPIQVVQGGLMGEVFRRGTDAAIDAAQPGLASIEHETTQTTQLRNDYGVIAFARSAPGTASSEFFINLATNRSLDSGSTARNPDGAGYATFGRVVAGLDVLEQIQDLPTDAPKGASSGIAAQILNKPVKIITARQK